jgi:Icc-related predicted phosphoesterase
VISHHAPSIRSIPDEYHNDLIYASFASNLENFIRETKPDFWIHGHVHEASDYFINQTRIICNPKGYPGEEVKGYLDNFIVEI